MSEEKPSIQEFTNFKKLIDDLPVFDSKLSVKDIEDGKYRDVENAVSEYAKSLSAQGKLAELLHKNVQIEGQTTTLDEYIREKKRYQITNDGTLYSTASARRDEIAGISTGEAGQGHTAQRAAFIQEETSSQQDAAGMFIKNLKAQAGAADLFKDATHVFDIGFHNGNQSAQVVESLKSSGISPDKIVYSGMELNPDHIETATKKLLDAGLDSNNIHLMGGKLGFTDSQLKDGLENNALKLSSNFTDNAIATDQRKSNDIVLAVNVTNFGDKDLFWNQVDAAMKPNAITIALHDAGGDLLSFRQI